MRPLELLSPAGDYSIFKAVIHAGADAVYVGGPAFGARAYANNFSEEELLEAIDYAHLHKRKLYLTVNTLFKEEELQDRLYDYLLPYYEQGLDAVIVQDFGVLDFVRRVFPGLAIHASTQMTVTGADGAAFLKSRGVSRIVTARELSFGEIQKIKEETGVEIESFVHGALCYCYSGQCLMSSLLGGRSGNRGRCAQPCRLPYEVLDGQKRSLTRKAEYILSPKDLSTAAMIPQLVECGIDSFKIEGRMKQAEYAAGVTSVYREYLNRYLNYGEEAFSFEKKDEGKLLDLGNRSGFTGGYYTQHNGADMITFTKPNHTRANETLQEEIRQNFLQKNLLIKIKGNLTLSKGKNATLSLRLGNEEVTAAGEEVAEARKKPLDRETVLEKINKTGNTPFVFEELNLELDDNIFVPIGQLNALRREALNRLQERLLGRFRRKGSDTCVLREMSFKEISSAKKGSFLSVSLETPLLLDLISAQDMVERIYLDADGFIQGQDLELTRTACRRIKDRGKQVFLILPAIFREPARVRYEGIYQELIRLAPDGFLIRNYEEAGFLLRKGYSGMIMADHNLYTYSNQAQRAFADCGIERNTIPLELNQRELQSRDNSQSELLIYGYLPLMVSAGCLHKSLHRCEHQEEVYYIKDRYGKEFAVKNHCQDCYNVIYNSSPLALFGMHREIEKLQPASYRIHFSMESVREAEQVLGFYREVFLEGKSWDKNSMKNYTNGHLKRGVE